MQSATYKVTKVDGTTVSVEAESPWQAAQIAGGDAVEVAIDTIDGKPARSVWQFDNAVDAEGTDEDDTSFTLESLPKDVLRELDRRAGDDDGTLAALGTTFWATPAGVAAQKFNVVYDDGEPFVDYDQPAGEPYLIATLRELYNAVRTSDRSKLESLLYRGWTL